MKPKVVSKNSTVLTLTFDRLPSDIQHGDMAQFVSPSGKARGKRVRTWRRTAVELAPVVLAAMLFGVFVYVNFDTVRYLWLAALSGIVLYLAGMMVDVSDD